MSDEIVKENTELEAEPEKKTFRQKVSDFFHRKDSTEVKMLRSERAVKRYQLFLLYLVILAIAVYVIFFAIIGITQMPSEDMNPNIKAGDVILFYRLDSDIKMQDVVVFKKTTTESKSQLFVGRVVAKPGDTVEISSGNRLIVNGNAILETNIYEVTTAREGYTEYPLTLADDEYFILVDARKEGTDSRYFGPVKEDEILGVIITIIRRNGL